MSRVSIAVIAPEKSQTRGTGQVLACAFQDDPLFAYILADEEERRTHSPNLFAALVTYTLVYGDCTTTPELEGAACWLRPGKTELTFWRILRTGFGLQTSVARFTPQARERFLGVMGYADDVHKRLMDRPHWYLWALGVDPGRQGRGIGSALLKPALRRADEEGFPCYLETQTEANVRFYEKRAFSVLESGDVPGHGVPFWTMVREPGS